MKLVLVLLLLTPHFAATQEKQTVRDEASRAEEKRREEYRELGKKAIEQARIQVAANPDSAEMHFDLAETLLKGPINADGYEEVANEFLKAIQLKPGYVEAHLRLGTFYANKDKYAKAFEAINKAISLKGDFAEAYLALGFLYLQEKFGGGGKLPRTEQESTLAAEAFQKAILIKPDLYGAYFGLGQATFYLKHYEEALRAFDQAAALMPGDPLSHMGLGSVYIELGNKSAAMREHDALSQIAVSLQKTMHEQGLDSFPNIAAVYADRLLKEIRKRFEDK